MKMQTVEEPENWFQSERHSKVHEMPLDCFWTFWFCISIGLEDREEKARSSILVWPRSEIEQSKHVGMDQNLRQ